MKIDSQLILLALGPVFVGLIILEAWYLRDKQAQYPLARYSWSDVISNATLALMHQGTDALTALGVILIYQAIFDFRLFEIPDTWWSFVLLFVLQDFLYYWFHRAHHRIRWCWAAHVVHHSSERLNLSTAFRQSLMYPVSGMWVFWLPLLLLGFSPEQTIAMVMLSLAYQFFIHTQVVDRLGWLETILNTPSHHRVHHARNDRYIDKNFGGTLIIWDRIFGTFVEELPELPCEYGIVRQIHTHNPLRLSFHEWQDMFRDAFARGICWRHRLMHLFGPPEWKESLADQDSGSNIGEGLESSDCAALNRITEIKRSQS
ncbi:sterol desaturase family protein [Hahella sp. CCB-MM4]|uniref:sterol desaturase family protein n=1 Tax=Hahella sp. (strain CCB-MM4) TaxID=1926491 RepID=UPI001AF025B1|nr:sterol desaturase family protein [Hahella sp. CCB-MM4]